MPVTRQGKCDLALQGRCDKVHDPAKVAVCCQWLQGRCDSSSCRLQHKVSRQGSSDMCTVAAAAAAKQQKLQFAPMAVLGARLP